MYGREKSAVVKPTNAVSATRNTLNGSTKNSRSRTSIGPAEITRTVSAPAAMSVQRLATTLISGAKSRSPMAASTTAPTSGNARMRTTSITVPAREVFRDAAGQGCRTARGSGRRTHQGSACRPARRARCRARRPSACRRSRSSRRRRAHSPSRESRSPAESPCAA